MEGAIHNSYLNEAFTPLAAHRAWKVQSFSLTAVTAAAAMLIKSDDNRE
jgi:hypothetical protein